MRYSEPVSAPASLGRSLQPQRQRGAHPTHSTTFSVMDDSFTTEQNSSQSGQEDASFRWRLPDPAAVAPIDGARVADLIEALPLSKTTIYELIKALGINTSRGPGHDGSGRVAWIGGRDAARLEDAARRVYRGELRVADLAGDTVRPVEDHRQTLDFLGTEIWTEIVTPDLAKSFLSRNINNRKMNLRAVARYAEDMSRGAWKIKPVAICFDESGRLGNGQHTLQAIIDSNTSQPLLIARNVPRESIAMMDVGQKRTISDIANFVGSELNSPHAAVVKILLARGVKVNSCTNYSFSQLMDGYEFYKDAVDFAFDAGGTAKRVGVNALTRAVAAMAWYTRDKDRIASFLQCVGKGDVTESSDLAATRLREFFLKTSIGSSKMRAESFNKAKTALDWFLLGKSPSKLYGSELDIFPYPHV